MTTNAKLQRDVQALLALLKSGIRGDCVAGSPKGEFRRLGRRILTAIAHGLGLPDGSYDVRWNPAGPAVSGEVTLHGERIYIQFSDSSLGILYRSCQGRTDYRGGPNQWLAYHALTDFDYAVGQLLRVHRGP